MKKKYLLLALGLLVAAMMQAQTYWDGTSNKVFSGSGTQADPYLISTPEQLAGLAERTNVDKEDFAGKYLKLTADIYLTNFNDTDTANWKQWEPIAHSLMQWNVGTDNGYFRGHFDGDGHTVYNLYYGAGMNWADDWDPNDFDIDLSAYDFSVVNKALFVNLDGGTIENLNIANAKMAGVNQALLVLNAEANSVIRNCHVEGELRGTQSGCNGLAHTNKGLIENCSATVNTNLQGGGAFVGTNDSTGVIRNCTSAGFMRCTMSDGSGFVSVNNGLIEKCTANVHVQALGGPDAQTNQYGGHTFRYRSGAGFVGTNTGIIRECAALGNVDGDGTTGNYIWMSGIAGFAYRNWGGRIESSYCTGTLRNVSDSTGGGGDPQIAHFCYDNGYNAAHYNDDMARGDIWNCYSTSNIVYHNAEQYMLSIHAFTGSFHDHGGFDEWMMEPSTHYGCYFPNESLPTVSTQASTAWNGTGKPLAQMKTQAFVDTLNMLASLLGTSQWELRDGLPRPTGVYLTDATVFFAGGDGTKANPYLISNKQELENLRWLVQQGMTFKGKYIRQTDDIALNAPRSEWGITAPKQWIPIGSPNSHPWYSNTNPMEFDGVYDGGFHEVKNMYINNLLRQQGLFGRVNRGAQLRNLGVTDAYIRAAGDIGILAGKIENEPIVIQCWTSGDIATQGQEAWNLGAILGDQAGHSFVLNCSSSAKLTGGNSRISAYVDAVYGGFNSWAQDTLVNFLFTGCMNEGNDGSFGHFQYRENFFADYEKTKVDKGNWGYSKGTSNNTEWTQSKELVNIYNYSVARWNERHAGNDTLQLHYWEWRENDYPRIAADANWKPGVKITFESNGGTHVTPKYVYTGVKLLPPQRPLREGYIFAGWYKDAGLTQFFDWQTETPTDNVTLYARWHEDKRYEIDIEPFLNEFATEYHIQTAAQLRGLAAMQNGIWDWGEKNDDCNGSSNIPMYPSNPVSQTQTPVSFAGKKIVLDNDILLCDTTDWQYWGRGAFGLPFKSIGSDFGVYGEGEHRFYGTFDGQGHTIYGLYQENDGVPNWGSLGGGLFGSVGNGAVIKNVGIAASCIDQQVYNTRGQEDDATRYWIRCGYSSQGAPSHTGMLAGYVVDSVTIDQCYSEGNMFVQSVGYTGLGGLIGQLGDASYYKTGKVTNCYSRVDVYNTSVADTIDYEPVDYGFTALGKQVPVTQCYSAGHTYHSFANSNNSYGDSVQNCYFDKELVQVKDYYSWGGGNHYIGDPKTTNAMHAKATYVDWDFDNIWGRHDTINDGYPYLRVFHEGVPADSEDPVIVTGITVDVKDTMIIAGQTLQVNATILPDEAADKRVTWSADTWGVSGALEYDFFESIDQNGLIKTHLDLGGNGYANGRSGNIRITATSYEGEYQASFILTIIQPSITILPVAYRRHGETEWKYQYSQWSRTNITTENFEYMVLAYTDIDAARTGLTWSVDNGDVLSITEMSDTVFNIDYVGMKPCSRAVVYAKGSGKATITATISNGQSKAHNVTISRIDLDRVKIYKSPYTSWQVANTQMGIGETQQLECVPYGDFSDSYGSGTTQEISYLPTIQWSSSNPAVLTVDENGMVTAVGIGTATITVTAVGTNVSATTETITVLTIEATGITINEGGYWDTFELYEGETKQLTATIQPENTTDKTVTWSSDNTSVATVDQYGLVTAVSAGNARITAMTSNGLSNSTNIRVKAIEPTGITINEKTGEIIPLYVGDTYQLSATVLPENAGNKTVRWSSEDNNIARVSSSGLVKAMGAGFVNITARTNNGLEDYVTFEVTVKPVDPVYYTIRFLNWDGAELQNSQVLEGNMPTYSGAMPVRPEDENYTYSFSGWSPAVVAATANADYTAQYTATEKTVTPPQPTYYTIRFLNYDGTELQSSQVKEGDMPVYNGTTPIKPEDEGHTYTFNGWLPAIVPAAADAIYIAQYTAIKKTVYYTVTFMDWDGTELLVEQVEEGHDAHGPETNPTREGYIFTGWSKPITNITANLIVIAQYEIIPQPVYYTIRFLNWDGEELQSLQVKEGEIPTYSGATPVRSEDENYTYSFSGWEPEIVAATANADYTAQYTATEKTVVLPDYLPYGLQAVVDGGMATLSWSVTDLPAYFGISVFCNGTTVIDSTTLNNNTSFGFVPEQYGIYTWRVCGANEMRELITEWVNGPSFEVKDPHEGIDEVRSDQVQSTKVLIDGMMYIIRPDGKVYDMTGQEVR